MNARQHIGTGINRRGEAGCGGRLTRLAGVAVIAGLLGGCGGASGLLDTSINDALASGFGTTPVGSEAEDREVDLRARGPLVLPPDYKLPQPQDSQAQEQQLGANWPTDPELIKKREAKERAAILAREEERVRGKREGQTKVLSPTELAEWGRRRPVVTGSGVSEDTRGGKALSPQELKSYGAPGEDATLADIPPEQQPLPPLPK